MSADADSEAAVDFDGLPVHLVAMVVGRLPVHPRPLATVPTPTTVGPLACIVDRSLTAELIAGSEYVDRDTGRSG